MVDDFSRLVANLSYLMAAQPGGLESGTSRYSGMDSASVTLMLYTSFPAKVIWYYIQIVYSTQTNWLRNRLQHTKTQFLLLEIRRIFDSFKVVSIMSIQSLTNLHVFQLLCVLFILNLKLTTDPPKTLYSRIYIKLVLTSCKR